MDRLNKIIKKVIKEATSDASGSRGSYMPPMQPGLRPFEKSSLEPFNQSVSDYKSPLVQYDSYDKDLSLKQNQIVKLERTASKIQDYIKHHHNGGKNIDRSIKYKKTPPFTQKVPFNEWIELSDDNLLNETSTSVTAGPYNAPLEIGIYKWKNELDPFTDSVDSFYNRTIKKNTLKNNIKRTVGVWEKDKNGSYKRDIDYPDTINEDLAVWFGTKKKPKGSSQPKGPWVNICRKVDGKHPPCGRTDTSKGAYPKCRAAGVASKMSDSQKRSACQQKRRAEKKDTQTGKGQKPVMTSYKPRKK
jgi:hypothetical protein